MNQFTDPTPESSIMNARTRNLVLCRRTSPATNSLRLPIRTSIAIGLVFALTFAAADAFSQETSSAQPKVPAAKPPTQQVTISSNISAEDQERIMAEVREIMAIRQQMGGGITEQLGGLQLNLNAGDTAKPADNQSKMVQMALSEKFAQELKQQAIQRAKLSDRSPTAANPASSPTEIQPLIPPPKSGTLNVGALTQQARDQVQILHLRKSAKMLEEAAANLETAQQYDQADKVRALAGEIWRSAR